MFLPKLITYPYIHNIPSLTSPLLDLIQTGVLEANLASSPLLFD